jgi:hypothetical protein
MIGTSVNNENPDLRNISLADQHWLSGISTYETAGIVGSAGFEVAGGSLSGKCAPTCEEMAIS